MAESLIVDANPLLSALLGGTAASIATSAGFELYSTQHTLFEVEKYLPRLARKLDKPELDLFRAFQRLPVIACQPAVYDAELSKAEKLIGDRDLKDAPLLALVLTLQFPIWTEDRDFDGIAGIEVIRTADLVARIGAD